MHSMAASQKIFLMPFVLRRVKKKKKRAKIIKFVENLLMSCSQLTNYDYFTQIAFLRAGCNY